MFPIGFYRDENGELNVQGIKIDDLAEEYGTPLFIYDTGLMEERFKVFLKTVKNVKGNIHYAVKACLLYTSPSPRDRQKSRMPSSA